MSPPPDRSGPVKELAELAAEAFRVAPSRPRGGPDPMIGRTYLDRGRPVVVLVRWTGRTQRNVLIRRADGTLVVRTESTAWATQLRLLSSTVLKRLNEELGSGTVKVVEVQGPRGPSWKHGKRGVRDGRGPRDTYG